MTLQRKEKKSAETMLNSIKQHIEDFSEKKMK
ncbi:hypothetical protein OKY_04731 [Enterococcus faecium EnGen0048]|nr:hypothetical protein OKY_04731 [Enterococcus faecium EnGen0048]